MSTSSTTARFATSAARDEHSYALADLLSAAFATRSTAVWCSELDAAGVPAGDPTATTGTGFLRDPENERSGRVAVVPHEALGHVREFAHLLRVSDAEVVPHRVAPDLGEHTDEILSWLGYETVQIDALPRSAHGPLMRFSIALFPYDRWGNVTALTDAVRLADDVGIDTVSFPEHIVMPVRADVAPISTVWYENFVLAAHLGAHARRIRFVFSAMVVPYRHPVHTAKLISTLDTVTEGRVSLVVGSGWLRREFRYLGVPYDERGEITDEYVRAMRVLWTDDKPQFDGKHVQFSDLAFFPRCVQQPHVPILAGGSGPPRSGVRSSSAVDGRP